MKQQRLEFKHRFIVLAKDRVDCDQNLFNKSYKRTTQVNLAETSNTRIHATLTNLWCLVSWFTYKPIKW